MYRASTKKFTVVFTVIFAAEFLIMYLIGHQREDSFWENLKIMLIDAVALSILVAPVLYLFLVKPLEDSLREIKILKGLMQVCCVCKKVKTGENSRNEKDWINIDRYLQENSEILFSHGYCPECHKKEMVKLEEFKRKKSGLLQG
ncbi:MAG: hypothetical protein KKG47_08180 [Proteobacteria bacterium]|nr:hypothetical protein [Pseudomonadota bacterium]MBU1738277.1 hypothetical protein [Pseudomonadota bacterium]